MKHKNIVSIIKVDGTTYIDNRDSEAYAICLECEGHITYGMTSCPDKKWGCCVAHWGFGCKDCKTVYHIKFDAPTTVSMEKFKVLEKIGVGFINPNGLSKLKIDQ